MPLKKTLLLLGASVLICSSPGFSQENILADSSQYQEVETLVIGQVNRTDSSLHVQITDSVAIPTVAVAPAVFPGSIKVIDHRDSVVFQIIPADDEIIAERIKGLENIMPMPYNKHVKKYVDYFLYKRPNFVKQMLEKKEYYFPIFEEYLAKHNIPDEMKYLSLLESGLEPKAVSHASAVGLWQFMAPTGREMGLRINDYVDERMHIEKSSDASFRYLTKLYDRFDDWELALAAYNTGPGRIRRAIRRSGKTDYWALHRYIHRDTRAYVPQWAALNYLMNYSAEHGIFPNYEETMVPVISETIVIDGPLNMASFASLNYMELTDLVKLNPHILRKDIPSYARNIDLKVPVDTYAYFEENKKCILDSAIILSAPNNDIIALIDAKGSYHIERKTVKRYYRVRSGDYLGRIASRNGVRVSDLKRWNGLRSSNIRSGQRLVFYKKQTTKVYDTVAPAKEVSKTVLASAKKPSVKENNKQEGSYELVSKTVKKYHFVRGGDNLTTIAKRNGTSIAKLKQWNNLKSSTILKGQRLAYYTKVTEKVYTGSATESGAVIVHTVQKGDTLWHLSKRYGYSVEQIKKLNGMKSNTLKVGQKIKVKT